MKYSALTYSRALLALGCVALLTTALNADSLVLRNGEVLQGTFAGGSASTISFNTNVGTQVFQRAQVASLVLTEQPIAPPATPVPPLAVPVTTPPPAPMAAQDITLPAGTLLIVRMQEQVTSDDQAGKNFMATLETDLVTANGVRAIPAGTKVYGTVTESKHARRLFGHAELELTLNQLLINNVAVPIFTGNFEEAATPEGLKTAGATGVGAGIGAIADGSQGARTGAAIGLGVAVLKKGDSVIVPPNALLQFQLRNSLTLRVGQ